MATDTEIDLSLLDRNLSDIEDLPSFEVPPKGSYIFLISAGTKKINDHPAIVFDLELVQTIELADKTLTPFKEGSKTGTMFMIDNETGLGFLKEFIKPFAKHFDTEHLGTLVKEHIQNVKIQCTMDHRVDKDDKTKIYARPKNVAIL